MLLNSKENKPLYDLINRRCGELMKKHGKNKGINKLNQLVREMVSNAIEDNDTINKQTTLESIGVGV